MVPMCVCLHAPNEELEKVGVGAGDDTGLIFSADVDVVVGEGVSLVVSLVLVHKAAVVGSGVDGVVTRGAEGGG